MFKVALAIYGALVKKEDNIERHIRVNSQKPVF